MKIDKEGFDLIDKGYQQDKAAQAEKRAKEVEAEFANDRYAGAPTDDEDRKREEERKQTRLDDLNAGDEQLLDHFHFGEYGGRSNALKQLDIERKIQETKQKWRERDKSKSQEKDRGNDISL